MILMHQKIIATIEARMGSSRLPGKVLLEVEGIPLLQLMIERVKRSKYIDGIVIATVDNDENLPIVSLAKSLGVNFFKGSEENVLERVVGAGKYFQADTLVQLTGDCPLIDPELIDECVEEFLLGKVDYVANELVRTYPIGFDVAVMSLKTLESTISMPDLSDADKEHVTTYIVDRPHIFIQKNIFAPKFLDRPELSITLDTKEDFEVIREIVTNLGKKDLFFSANKIIEFLDARPDISSINKSVIRKSKK